MACRFPQALWLSVSLVQLLVGIGSSVVLLGRDVSKVLQKAKLDGVTGYDLIEAVEDFLRSKQQPYGYGVQLLDTLGNQDKRATMADWSKIGLPEKHFAYFDKDGNGRLSKNEALIWFMQRKPAKTMNLSEVDDPPKGHLGKLFSWKPPLPSDDLVYTKPFPHPRDFWKKHMDGYLPALLKGAQAGWPCMQWTRQVLVERFGWVDVKLEPKIEARGNVSAYKELDGISADHRLNISEYLRLEEGRNMYVVSIIPQKMAWEVAHPMSVLCGSREKMIDKSSKPPYTVTDKHEYPHESKHAWMTHLFEANLWIGSGRTRSQFHYDKEWNVNCLLSGRKRWVFLNPFWYHEDIHWARGNQFRRDNPLNNYWTDWIYLDPDAVDLIVQHKLRNMDYYELIQEAGDCVFIPYAMMHQVEKLDEDLQVAVSWMFLPETIYDDDACEKAPLDEDLPLAVMDTLYMYTGKGLIPQGYNDPLNFVNKVSEAMQKGKEKHLSFDTFQRLVRDGDSILAQVTDGTARARKIYDLISTYAASKKGLTRKQLRKVPLRIWCKPASEGDADGALPCDVGQEYELCDDAEYEKMEKFLQEKLAHPSGNRPTPQNMEPMTHRRIYPDVGAGRNAHSKPKRVEEL